MLREAAHTLLALTRLRVPTLIATGLLTVLLVLDLCEKVKVDAWTIVLIAFVVLPWTYQSVFSVIGALGTAFSETNFKSISVGSIKVELLEQRQKIDEQTKKIDEQRRIIDDLALYSMAFYIYDKLKFLTLGTTPKFSKEMGEYKYVKDEPFDHDLRYLRDHGYLEHFQIGPLITGENLVGKIKVTEMGRRFVELKEQRLLAVSNVSMPSIHV